MQEPEIAASAYKHGEADEDILHAFNNPMFTHRNDEGFVMIVGPTTDAILIEIGYIVSDDDTPVIIHAMRPARRKFLL